MPTYLNPVGALAFQFFSSAILLISSYLYCFVASFAERFWLPHN
jgi:hypothetical protein